MVKRNKKHGLVARPRVNPLAAVPEGVIIFGAPLAVEYPAPTLFVVGPTIEMSQYTNAGQLYYNTDDNRIYMYIP